MSYRLRIDLRGLFTRARNVRFGDETCTLKITLKDSFIKENNGSVVVHFEKGLASVKNGGWFDAQIQLDVADFSSMFMGVISFNRLNSYGLVEISETQYANRINRLFSTETRPICMTTF